MKKIILRSLAVILLIFSWWGYKLVWGKPFNVNHFFERALITFALEDPEMLTQLGMIENTFLDFHSDDLTDRSMAFENKMMGKVKQNLAILRSYDLEDLNASQQLSYRMLEYFLQTMVDGEAFQYHSYPVNQLFGVQNNLPSFMESMHRIEDEGSARNYLSRLSQIDRVFEQTIAGLQHRQDIGVVPPRFVIEKVLTEMRGFIDTPVQDNILYETLSRKLAETEVDSTTIAELLAEAEEIITGDVYPGYRVLIEFMAGQLDIATTENGVWKLPDGEAFYQYTLKQFTSTDYTPDDIHALGLSEVARIEKQMLSILRDEGFTSGTVGDRVQALQKDPRYQYPDTAGVRDQIMADYQAILDEIDAGMDRAFNLRPESRLEVLRVPEFKEDTAPGAYYQPPSMDGKRPGKFYANLRDVSEISKPFMRTLAYHEGIPGHHYQIAIQTELQNVPMIRRLPLFTAYTEGWGLYAERVAWELGFQDDPLDNLGRLQAEMMRAVRLVVDSGLHAKRWTREKAIDYMLEKTGMSESDVVTEIERYIVMPGQATAYKVGMLKILELREKARTALGEAFDIREFHTTVLQNGALPLTMLEEQVDDYIRMTLETQEQLRRDS